jgi:hypothetical protein
MTDKDKISKAAVLARGWTEGLINRFMPVPDKEKSNPKYKCAAPMKLYALTRVEEIEASDEFKEAKEKSDKSKLSCSAGVETKRSKTRELVKSLSTLSLEPMQIDQLRDKAIDHYNISYAYWHGSKVSKDSADGLLNNISVIYLFDMCSKANPLSKIKGKVGNDGAYVDIEISIFQDIAMKYPHLERACNKEIKKRKKEIEEAKKILEELNA